MRRLTRSIAALQLALIFPAVLFMTAVFVAAGHAHQYDLGNIAQAVVMWYSARMWTLPLLLLALPFAVVGTGCATLLRSWNRDLELPPASRQLLTMVPAPLATLFIPEMTLTSAWILLIVVLHMLAN